MTKRSARSAFHRLDPRACAFGECLIRLGVQSSFTRTRHPCRLMQDRSPPSGNSSFCIMLPRRNSELPSTLALALAATCTARLRGRCFQPTSATDSLQRAPDSDRAVPSVRVACASGTPRRSKLREATRVIERLTAPYELRKHSASRLIQSARISRGIRLRGWNPFLIGDLIIGPLGFTPRLAALSSARQESGASSDALQE